MLPIVLASIMALAICLERLWFLQKEKIVPRDCLSGFQDLLMRIKYTEEELRAQASSSLVGWVCFDILKKAAPLAMPTAIAQNIKTISKGSFRAVLNLTILNAPTIPSERIRLDDIVNIIKEVTKDTITREILKL